MNSFLARGGQFWLNDQPQFIQAGEFHYFRTSRDQWVHRLGLLKAAGFNTLATYIPWLWHQLEENVSDLDGHSHPMRDLAGFLDLAAEMGFWIIARPGPYIMAETTNEGIPPWVFQKYPQAAYISQDHKVQNIASYLQPDFLACVKGWYRAIFEVLAPRQVVHGGKLILVQLDNEMGMMQWVRRIMDINPHTISRFANYLRHTYEEELSMRYPSSQLEDFLSQGLSNPQELYALKIVEDYRRFYRSYLREYTDFLWSEAVSNGMEVLPVINIHGFGNGGKTFPIGLSQLAEVIKMDGMVSATDVYPLFINDGNFHQLLMVNEMTKALQNQQQPLFSIEFQSGGNHDFGSGQTSMYDLHTRLCISSGMRAINHYSFFGGENDPVLSPVKRHDWGPPVRPDGTLRRHYHRYQKLSKVLDAYGVDLILSVPQTVTTIGFILDTFMTEVNNEFTKEITSILTHQRDDILFDMIAKGLAITHRPFRVLELDTGDLDVLETPLCWVMMENQCNAGTQQKLVNYVNQGGKLVLIGRMCVEDFHHRPCTVLKEAVGIGLIQDDPPFTENFISVFQYKDVPVSFLETYSGEFDEVFAVWENGEAAGFIKTMGQGKVMMLGAAVPANTLDDLDIIHQMAVKMECRPLFKLSDWVDTRLSRAENGSFLFLNNYQDDPVETTIVYENETLFGGNPVRLQARSGLILPLDWQVRPDVVVHYVTAEISEITDEGSRILVQVVPDEYWAELSLAGYRCEGAVLLAKAGEVQRVGVHGDQGVIVLEKV